MLIVAIPVTLLSICQFIDSVSSYASETQMSPACGRVFAWTLEVRAGLYMDSTDLENLRTQILEQLSHHNVNSHQIGIRFVIGPANVCTCCKQVFYAYGCVSSTKEKEEKSNGVQSSNFIAPNMQIKLNHNHSIFSTVAQRNSQTSQFF